MTFSGAIGAKDWGLAFHDGKSAELVGRRWGAWLTFAGSLEVARDFDRLAGDLPAPLDLDALRRAWLAAAGPHVARHPDDFQTTAATVYVVRKDGHSFRVYGFGADGWTSGPGTLWGNWPPEVTPENALEQRDRLGVALAANPAPWPVIRELAALDLAQYDPAYAGRRTIFSTLEVGLSTEDGARYLPPTPSADLVQLDDQALAERFESV